MSFDVRGGETVSGGLSCWLEPARQRCRLRNPRHASHPLMPYSGPTFCYIEVYMKLPSVSRWVLRHSSASHDIGRCEDATQGISPSGACGNGRNERWVRDSWGNADFTGACRSHDRCYETCGASKADCDQAFGGEMRAACDHAYPSRWHAVQRRACRETANTYQSAVNNYGGSSFTDAQRESGC